MPGSSVPAAHLWFWLRLTQTHRSGSLHILTFTWAFSAAGTHSPRLGQPRVQGRSCLEGLLCFSGSAPEASSLIPSVSGRVPVGIESPAATTVLYLPPKCVCGNTPAAQIASTDTPAREGGDGRQPQELPLGAKVSRLTLLLVRPPPWGFEKAGRSLWESGTVNGGQMPGMHGARSRCRGEEGGAANIRGPAEASAHVSNQKPPGLGHTAVPAELGMKAWPSLRVRLGAPYWGSFGSLSSLCPVLWPTLSPRRAQAARVVSEAANG